MNFGNGYMGTTVPAMDHLSQVSSPVLRLLISAIQRHMSTHSDGATITAALCLFMTERALQLSLQQKRSLVVNLLDVITECATTHLMSDQCPVRCTLQLDNLDELLQLLPGFSFVFLML